MTGPSVKFSCNVFTDDENPGHYALATVVTGLELAEAVALGGLLEKPTIDAAAAVTKDRQTSGSVLINHTTGQETPLRGEDLN